MVSKLANLQSALDNTRASTLKAVESRRPATPPEPKAEPAVASTSRQANRIGKVNVAAWLDPAFKNSIRLVQARRPGSIQELMEEALNDLFAKYDVPQVSLKND
jgi:hypothetical protein